MVETPQGNSEPKSEQVEVSTTPQFATPEQVNSAITQRTRKLEAALQASTAKVEELYSKLYPKEESEQEPKVNPKEVPEEVRSLKTTVSRLEKESAQAKAEKEAEVAKRLDSEKKQTSRDLLIKNGIRPEMTKYAIAALDIQYEDGQLIGKNEAGESVELESFIKSWASTPDAQAFKPARGSVGSGDKAYKQKTSSFSNPNDEKALQEKLVRGIKTLMNGG
jgi:hypothetical protein